MAELAHALAQITAALSRWPQYLEGTRRYVMRRFPFVLIYRDLEGTIQILAIAHGRRRPGYWYAR